MDKITEPAQPMLHVTEAELLPSDTVARMLAQLNIEPLPTYTWKTRPLDMMLGRGEICSALVEAKGNVSAAARLLKVSRARVSSFISRDSFTKGIYDDILEMVVDDAEETMGELLETGEEATKLQAAKFILSSSKAGKKRGYGAKLDVDGTVKADDTMSRLLDMVDGSTRSK